MIVACGDGVSYRLVASAVPSTDGSTWTVYVRNNASTPQTAAAYTLCAKA